MKKKVLPFLLPLLLLFSACGKASPDAPVDTPPAPVIVDEETRGETADNEDPVAAFDALRASPDGFTRRVTSPDAVVNAVQNADGYPLLLDAEAGPYITIPEGDYSNADLILDSDMLTLRADGSLGTLTVNAVSEEDLLLNGHVQGMSVFAEQVSASLSGGADRIYVMGKNCSLHLKGGTFGPILTVSDSLTVRNDTSETVTILFESGARVYLLPGNTYGQERQPAQPRTDE